MNEINKTQRDQNTAHPRRRNVTTSIIGLRNGQICKHLIRDGEPPRYSWRTQKKKKKKETLHFIFKKSLCLVLHSKLESTTTKLKTPRCSENAAQQKVESRQITLKYEGGGSE